MRKAREHVIGALVDRQRKLRLAVLAGLYALRFESSEGADAVQIANALDVTTKDSVFALFFLEGMGYVQRNHAQYFITACGMEVFEKEFQ